MFFSHRASGLRLPSERPFGKACLFKKHWIPRLEICIAFINYYAFMHVINE